MPLAMPVRRFVPCTRCGCPTVPGRGVCSSCIAGRVAKARCWVPGCSRPSAHGTIACQLHLDLAVARFRGLAT